MLKEVWKTIPNTNKYYDVSNLGRVRSWKSSRWNRRRKIFKILEPNLHNKYGYVKVALYVNNERYDRLIHQLVLENFIGKCPKGMECRHLDDDSINNELSNLKWDTHQKNMQDRFHKEIAV